MKDLKIHPVDSSNWRQVVSLKMDESQQSFIESNEISLLESIYDTKNHWTCYGLFFKEEAVGFMMIGAENKEEKYIWLDRFMIDRDHQGKGLGSAFIPVVKEYIFTRFDVNEIVLSVTKNNLNAKTFYEKHGFKNTGLIDQEFDEEIFSYHQLK
ncbi:GNAT family N-acetyltransferase [Salipaludibacillus daqingensis]|uniref:GNAT family N-acetyltransferase n=1 Tax=Salipaludibacillus daqingensis TaxID=3041001 RepID=UPI002473DB91|nr:GNAT family N-acetyltransferase [Salipaludibacillus daqingensis]